MKRPVTNLCGKTVELDCDVYLNGELQYGEDKYDAILWAESEDDKMLVERQIEILSGLKVLFVLEREFKQMLAMKELGYLWN